MEITREYLTKKLAEAEAVLTQTMQDVNAVVGRVQGAVATWRALLAEFDKPAEEPHKE